jgi:hypothetical protein
VAPGTGNGFGQDRVDLIQQFTFGAALRKGFSADALFAGAFYQIADFEIVFIFEPFFCHFSKDAIHYFLQSAVRFRKGTLVP